ncbi:type I-E CRISPR-associated protein Cas5/CasD [Sphingomonas sp. Mn802worker]|uniref:type I-E CRISPR-associated protein Cas5/CasD n=1 Tax=Sphingomonas sp. Mn802worker TaxID=629773 RepID=UPI0003719EDB|nr:type I-E CRISPR-associated protein Cas5/CasD [Sphingomonas sp. Mn802worker]
MNHLLIDLDAPLMSFGGNMVDAYGVVRDFPAKSMIAGLFANALGWERFHVDAHALLQARLTIGAARIAEGQRVQDFQTAKLEAGDRGWTTRGRIEGRAGGADTYKSPHIRYRDMDADARVLVACRLASADDNGSTAGHDTPDLDVPDLAALARALTRPERPLFIGRKPFVPSRPLLLGIVDAETIPDALTQGLALIADSDRRDSVRAQWPYGELTGDALTAATAARAQEDALTDERHWPSGMHAGLRRVIHGRLDWPLPTTDPVAEETTA